jgi:hypothetical protein
MRIATPKEFFVMPLSDLRQGAELTTKAHDQLEQAAKTLKSKKGIQRRQDGMKKILVLSLLLVALAGLASATPVGCGILMKGNSSTTLVSSMCTVNPDPGFFISSLTLTGTDDYAGDLFGNPVVTYAATFSESGPVFMAPVFCNVTTGLFHSQPCNVTILPSSTVTGLDLSTYTIGLINGSNTVTGGGILGASIVLALDLGETAIPGTKAGDADAPEPTTLGLMGGALLGLALLARKKQQ